MYSRADKVSGFKVTVLAGFWVFGANAYGQGIADNLTSVSGSASVFTGVNHTRTDLGSQTESTTEPSAGISGNLGGNFQSGSKSLQLRYGGSLETRRDTFDGGQTDRSSVTGAAQFNHADPASRFDFNAGHTVSSVRNNTGFVIEPSSYDTRNTISAGAGLRFYPGDLTTLRFSGQAGRSFGSGDLNGSESVTSSAQLSRRLTERSSASLVASRSWSDDNGVDNTIDSAQVSYSRSLASGSFSAGVGVSRSETDLLNGSTSENTAETGFLNRTWATPDWQTTIGYDRSLSDSATDLSLETTEFVDFFPDSIRVRGVVVSDTLTVTHNNARVCDICSLGLVAQGAVVESQITGATSHEYQSGINLGLQLTSLQSLSFDYSWQGDAGENSGTIIDQIHRLGTRWTRKLAENTSFSVDFSQSYLRTKSARNDQDQFALRLILTRGFSLTGNYR